MNHTKFDQRQQERLPALNAMAKDQLPAAQAAELMGISERHALRLRSAFRKNGAAALVHGNRGHKPPNSVPEATAARVVDLARGRYADLSHSRLTEVLAEREGIRLARGTVSRLLKRSGLVSSKIHRHYTRRTRRDRMPQEGMLLQIGGRRHRWLEDRGPRCALLLAVDDATGTVASATFCREEQTLAYFLLMESVINRFGIPWAIYVDRHGGFESNFGSGRPHNPDDFTRAIGDLHIIRARNNSLRFEGRVQPMVDKIKDGLVDELRRARARNIDQANAVLRDFLPGLNERFRVMATQPEIVYRPVDPSICLAQTLSLKHSRRVGRDNTVKCGKHTLQLPLDQKYPSHAGLRVEVLEHTDGRLTVQYDGDAIHHQEAPPSLGVLRTP